MGTDHDHRRVRGPRPGGAGHDRCTAHEADDHDHDHDNDDNDDTTTTTTLPEPEPIFQITYEGPKGECPEDLYLEDDTRLDVCQGPASETTRILIDNVVGPCVLDGLPGGIPGDPFFPFVIAVDGWGYHEILDATGTVTQGETTVEIDGENADWNYNSLAWFRFDVTDGPITVTITDVTVDPEVTCELSG